MLRKYFYEKYLNIFIFTISGLDHRTVHLVERLPGVPGGGSVGSSPLLQRRGRDARDENAASGLERPRSATSEILQQQMVMGAVALPSGDLTRDQIAVSYS